MKKTLMIISILVTLIITVNAQSVLSNGGGNFEDANSIISWTVGETFITTLTNSSIILTQGFHQSSLKVTSIKPNFAQGMEIKAYPNPTVDYLNLKFEGDLPNDVSYRVLDQQGRVLSYDKVTELITEIDFSSYTQGVYIINAIIGIEKVSTITIIKN